MIHEVEKFIECHSIRDERELRVSGTHDVQNMPVTYVTRVEWTVQAVVRRVRISNTGTSSAAEEALSWTFQLFKWHENMPLLPAV